MAKVLMKHKWTCPKCGEKVKFGDITNRDTAEFAAKFTLIIGISVSIGIVIGVYLAPFF